jgi:hypothetical protein
MRQKRLEDFGLGIADQLLNALQDFAPRLLNILPKVLPEFLPKFLLMLRQGLNKLSASDRLVIHNTIVA